MTPISNNSLLRELSQNPNDLIVDNLNKLRNYTSEFNVITNALEQIPNSEDLRSLNVIKVLRDFNCKLADCGKILDPLPFISSVEELENLEQQLNECDEFLGALWHSLPIEDKPELNDITQIREWFENPQNQSLLDTVTDLDLKDCRLVQMSKDFFKLRELESLKISADKTHIISASIFQRFSKLKEVKVEENYLMKLLAQSATTSRFP